MTYQIHCESCGFHEVVETLQEAREVQAQHRLTPSEDRRHQGVSVYQGPQPIQKKMKKKTLQRVAIDSSLTYCELCDDENELAPWSVEHGSGRIDFLCDRHLVAQVGAQVREQGLVPTPRRKDEVDASRDIEKPEDEDDEFEDEDDEDVYTVWCNSCCWKKVTGSLEKAEKLQELHNSLQRRYEWNPHVAKVYNALPPILTKTDKDVKMRIPMDKHERCEHIPCKADATWSVVPWDIDPEALTYGYYYCDYHLGAHDERKKRWWSR